MRKRITCPHCGEIFAPEPKGETPYEKLSSVITDKVNVVAPGAKSRNHKIIRRRLSDSLKWDLRIRRLLEITDEQLPAALEYVRDYEIGE